MGRRDLTKAQFRRAAEKAGFRVHLGCWLYCEETHTGYGGLLRPNGGGIYRRESLAKAIRERARDMSEPGRAR